LLHLISHEVPLVIFITMDGVGYVVPLVIFITMDGVGAWYICGFGGVVT
jgi:hypothetical protein